MDECVKTWTDLRDGRNPLGRQTFLELLDTDLSGNDFQGHNVSKLTCATQFKVKTEFVDVVLHNTKAE